MATGANLTANFGANTANFSAGVQEIQRQLNQLNTAFEANKQAINAANKEIKDNEKELEKLNRATNNGATATAAQAQEMQRLRDAIAQDTANLGSLRTAQQTVTAQQRQLNQQLQQGVTQTDNSAKANEQLKNSLKGLATEAAAVGGAITAVVGGIYKLTADAALMADDINTLSTVSGLSTESIQKYTYACNLCDIEVQTVADSLKELKKAMLEASEGSDKAKVFEKLGVSIKATNGELRDAESVFYDVIEALHQMPNVTERDATAFKILADQASKLNTLIADGGANFKAVSEQMDKYILPQETLDRLNDFNNRIDTIKARWKGISTEIGAEFADSFNGAFDAADGLLDKLDAIIADGEFKDFANELADDMLAVGEAIGKTAKFVWDFKDEIGATATAVLTFKAALNIGNVINATVTAVKSFTGATQAATTAQAAMNAVGAANPYVLIGAAIAGILGGIAMYASNTETATEKTKDLQEKAKELNQTAKESKKAAEDVSALVDEYKDLATNLSDSADAKSRLQQIQETLNTTYGIEDDKLDLVNGKYKEQLELLQGISEEKKAQSERDITEAYQKARDTQNSTYSMSIKHNDDVQYLLAAQAFSTVSNYNNSYDMWGSNTYAGIGGNRVGTWAFNAASSYDDRIAVINQVLKTLEDRYGKGNVDTELYSSLNAVLKDLESAKATYELATKNYNDMINPPVEDEAAKYMREQQWKITSGKHTDNTYTPPAPKLTADEKKELYDKYVADLDYQKSMDYIGDDEYYTKLAQLRDTYLEKNSDAWKKANIAIHNYQKSLNKSTEKTLGDTAEKESERVVSALERVKKAYSDTLEAIDKEIEKHDREKEDAEIDKKINTVIAKLKYDKVDDLTRRELEKELQSLKEEKAEIEYDRKMEDAKAAAQAQYNSAESLYNSADDSTKAVLDKTYTATLPKITTDDLTQALNNATAAINRLNDTNTGAVSSISNTTTSNTTNNNRNNINVNVTGIDKAIDNLADEIKRAITDQL